MRKALERLALEACPRAQLAQAFEKTAARIIGCRQTLAGGERAGAGVEQCEVGKRAADVDAQ
jgi:hypothetical protein